MQLTRQPLLTAALLLAAWPAASAQVWDEPLGEKSDAALMNSLPAAAVGAGVIQRVDNQVPLSRTFVDSNGEPVVLSDLIDGELPVLLTLNYSDCPMLCDIVLTGVVDNMREMNLEPGEDYRVITLSINPDEAQERAASVKARYVKSLGREGGDEAWTFLRGSEEDIKAVANAVGFGFVKIEGGVTTEYSHPSTLIVLTPEGRVSLYLTAVSDDPQTVRLALVDASGGKIGNVADLFFTTCFRYDAARGKYAPIAKRIMAIGGGVFVLGLASLLITFRALEKRRSAEETEQ